MHHSNLGVFGIRQGDWKLELGLGSGGCSDPRQVDPVPGGPQGQLYNLAVDPGEQRKLWMDQQDVMARYKAEGAQPTGPEQTSELTLGLAGGNACPTNWG